MECLTYCLYHGIDISALEKLLKANSYCQLIKRAGVLEVIDQQAQSCLYIFQKGTLVAWNLKRHQLLGYFNLLDQVGKNKLTTPIVDSFFYQIGKKTEIEPHERFNVDCLTLHEDDAELKLGVSYGFSQSIKLRAYESRLEDLIKRCKPLTEQMAKQGGIKLSHKKIRKIIGEITLVQEEISLASNLLYQPKFFWQHPALEEYYQMIHDYLDVDERTEMINHQLETLSSIFMMFNSYLESKHSYNLELLIVILIFVEIIVALFHITI
jgi:required for meiotic nuclear division protein 1